MSGYPQQDNFSWSPPPDNQYNFDSNSFGQPNQQFEFANYGDQTTGEYGAYNQQEYLNPNQSTYSGDLYTPDNYNQGNTFTDEEDEPPLLEELGIDPDRIIQKTLAVLNPFHRRGQTDDANYLLQDADLAGPLAFCLALASFLVLAGSKAHFGYVYGLAVTSCLLMYILQYLMSSSGNVTLASVASVFGLLYSTSPGGLIFAVVAVLWATLSSSRLFCAMSGEEKQRLLIAYPCLLLYGVFTLIVIF
ncbi:unnamed protein product [Trichogramma brassicae]|uniref:Protein YIPF n=1 Tax=Trichogramma brassicae TaxID=86971 RepID=A0A6H5IUV7_9HYME|nr:unnamed protein product [Trichogramma brassicae]